MAKIQRRKNTIAGTATGLLLQFFNLLVPLFIRSVFIKYIGVEFAGLDSLFKSVLQVLNLAELGVGSALVFSMYKPIVEDDDEEICALLKLYKVYYRIIGTVIFVIGVALTPILKYIIKGAIPSSLNLYVLYYLNLSATVLSYWIFAYKSSILVAYQRTDIINIVTFGVSIIKYLFQIYAIIIWKDYYLYLVFNLFFQLVINCVIAFVTSKRYPKYLPCGNISKAKKKEINKKVRDLFTAKLGGVIVNSADSIVISAFFGLVPLTIYNNYYYILSAVNGVIAVFYNALKAGIANELIVDSKEKKNNDFNIITFICFWIISICAPCFLNIYQPFVSLWVGEELLMSEFSVYLFVIYFVVFQIPMVWLVYKDAAGVWRQDRFRPLIGALTNLIINVFLVQIIGINGILISTIVSYVFVSIPWLLVNIRKYVIEYNKRAYYSRLLKYLSVVVFVCLLSKIVCSSISFIGIPSIIVYFLISACIGFMGFLIVFIRSDEIKSIISMMKNLLREVH